MWKKNAAKLSTIVLPALLAALSLPISGHALSQEPHSPRGAMTEGNKPHATLLPSGAGSDWWLEVQRKIKAAEYDITTREKKTLSGAQASWQAPNRAHNFRTHFTGRGIRVVPRGSGGTPAWTWTLVFAGYGAGQSPQPAGDAEAKVNGNRVEYRRGDISEWYLNDVRGLEQGFTLHGPPSGAQAGEGEIVISMKIGGDLQSVLNASTGAVDFYSEKGVPVLEFGGLHAVDAAGRVLPARFAVNGALLDILVDARDALYPINVDPILTSLAWTTESDQFDAQLGISVATAGDVNGDGYGDVIVAAHYFDNGQENEGRAYLFLGSASGLSTTPAWTAEGDQANAHFGCSVATAGDVNGDGHSDVIIGASSFSNGQTAEGRAYLFLGTASGLSATPAWTAEGDQDNAAFGYSVATAGDVNGDGYDDVIIGAPNFYNGEYREGRVFLFLGSASGLYATPTWTAESNQVYAYFGYSVATAGDVNGDGYADVIIGAYFFSNGESYEGRAFVYLGGASGLSPTPAWTAESNQANAYFGNSVASAGDVNGDGYDDVIVGAYFFSNGETYEGRAFVYLGGASGLSPTPAWTAEANQANAKFGTSVATAGDVNGDGYSDVIVGAPDFSNGETFEGRAFVYLGGASGLSPTPAWTGESDKGDARFGFSVATAGDVNGDGLSDVIIGAPYFSNPLEFEGRAYLYITPQAILTLSITGSGSGIVTSTPSGISGNVSCSATFPLSTVVTLHAEPSEFSLFSGWALPCVANPSGDCVVTMDGDKNVSAPFAFDTAHKTRIGTSANYYATLQEAYNNTPGGGAINAWATEFIENLSASSAKGVTLNGGLDEAYNPGIGRYTVLHGILSIQYGSLAVSNFIIR